MQSSKLINLYIYYKRTLANVYFIHLRSHSIIFIWLVATLLVLQYVFTTDARILIRKFLFHFILLWSPAVRFLWHMCYIHNSYLCIFLSVAAAKKGSAAVSFPFSDCLPFRFELVELSMQKKKSQQATRTNKHKHTQVGFVIFVRLSFFIYEFHGFPLNILCCCWPRNPSDFHCQASENAKITKKSSQPATHFGTNWLTDWLTDSALPHKTSNLTGFH